MLLARIRELPLGYSEVKYQGKKYGVTRMDFNKGKSYKIYAEELGGTDFISANFYVTRTEEKLKPCEMPEQKVLHFLNHYQRIV